MCGCAGGGQRTSSWTITTEPSLQFFKHIFFLNFLCICVCVAYMHMFMWEHVCVDSTCMGVLKCRGQRLEFKIFLLSYLLRQDCSIKFRLVRLDRLLKRSACYIIREQNYSHIIASSLNIYVSFRNLKSGPLADAVRTLTDERSPRNPHPPSSVLLDS